MQLEQSHPRKRRHYSRRAKAAEGQPQSKTLRATWRCTKFRQVLDCGCPSAAFISGASQCPTQSTSCPGVSWLARLLADLFPRAPKFQPAGLNCANDFLLGTEPNRAGFWHQLRQNNSPGCIQLALVRRVRLEQFAALQAAPIIG